MVNPAPIATVVSAITVTRRRPNRSTTAAANGAPRPYTSRFTATAPPISAGDQPNSCCSGSSSTPGVARNPAAVNSTTNVAAATTQA